ncbi:MAG: phenylacetate--CoA ligase family protein [Empedobacter falsenii]
MNLQNIYNKSPYFVKEIMVNFKAFLNKKQRYTKDYNLSLEILNDNTHKTYSEIKEFQLSTLKSLLLECYKYSKYYNLIFRRLGISEECIINDPFFVLNKMPLLEKETRKKEVENIINTNPNRKISKVGHTSGTTGTPTKNYLDTYSQSFVFAIWTRFHNMIGINKFDKNIRFSSNLVVNPNATTAPFWIFNRLDNQLLMSVFHLKQENLNDYVKKIIDFAPKYIDGFPSAIFIVAKYINDNNIKLNIKLDGICTTAETLYDNQRDEIEKAFNCKVYNQYASSEGSPFITECKYGKMHLLEDTGIFEILNDNNEECKPGELGRLVVTSFTNWKTPLLRYNILDYALKSNDVGKCKCGSNFKYVDSIHGRANDMLWTYEKGYVSGGIASALKDIKGILKTQIIQNTPDDLVVKIIKESSFKEDYENLLIKKLKDRLGSSISIKIEYVNNIEHAKSGKIKFLTRLFDVNDYLNQ